MVRTPRHVTRTWYIAVGTCLVAGFVFGLHAYGNQTTGAETRSDVIFIDSLAQFGSLQRQPVPFKHDLHTLELLKDTDKDCTLCHMVTERSSLSPLFRRLQNTDKETLIHLYHDNCLGCHTQLRQAGAEAGPITCGGCHPRKAQVVASMHPAGFDLPLHARHIDAAEEKCEACHHQYDAVKKTLYYSKGEEVSCRDCHRGQNEENRRSMRIVSHEACIGCHRGYSASVEEDQTPITCSGCHDRERREAIKVAEHVARLKRGQPDIVLLHPSREDLALSKMNTVPFNHEAHEGAVQSCRACHHETLKPCTECHSIKAAEKAKGVTLETAMHEGTSTHSCIGCHKNKTFQKGCSGCHSFMEQGRLGTAICQSCHYGPSPGSNRTGEQWRSASSHMNSSFSLDAIPKDVTIDVLADMFEPVVFPHRRIVAGLNEEIARSKLATHFHISQDRTCQGCHHHTPMGQTPPRCGNCHGKPFDKLNLFMPGLLGAYHQQCIGCHERMSIEPVSSCTGCHKKTQEQQHP